MLLGTHVACRAGFEFARSAVLAGAWRCCVSGEVSTLWVCNSPHQMLRRRPFSILRLFVCMLLTLAVKYVCVLVQLSRLAEPACLPGCTRCSTVSVQHKILWLLHLTSSSTCVTTFVCATDGRLHCLHSEACFGGPPFADCSGRRACSDKIRLNLRRRTPSRLLRALIAVKRSTVCVYATIPSRLNFSAPQPTPFWQSMPPHGTMFTEETSHTLGDETGVFATVSGEMLRHH
jgi:hypothetical protein